MDAIVMVLLRLNAMDGRIVWLVDVVRSISKETGAGELLLNLGRREGGFLDFVGCLCSGGLELGRSSIMKLILTAIPKL